MRLIGQLFPWVLLTLLLIGLIYLDQIVTHPFGIPPSRLIVAVVVLLTLIGIVRQARGASEAPPPPSEPRDPVD